MGELEEARCPLCAAAYRADARGRRAVCPHCGATVRIRLVRHEAAMARRAEQAAGRAVPQRAGVYLLAEDVRSLWNVGSFFRSADGLAVAHVFLCGITGIPPNPEIHRTALGADDCVSWSYAVHGLEIVRDSARPVVALEKTPRAVALSQATRHRDLLLIVGNEIDGVSPELLDAAPEHVHIPMLGLKNSLNVAVAAGIALHHYADFLANSAL